MTIDSQERDSHIIVELSFLFLLLVAIGVFFICKPIQSTMVWVILGLYALLPIALIVDALFFSTKKLFVSICYKDDVFQQIDKFKAYSKYDDQFMIDLINRFYKDEGVIDILISEKYGIGRLFKRSVYLRNHIHYTFGSKEVSIVFLPIIIGWILPAVGEGQEGLVSTVVVAVVLFLAWILLSNIMTKEYDTRNEVYRYELMRVEEKIRRLKERQEIQFESDKDVVRQIMYVELRKVWCFLCCKKREKHELLRHLDEGRDTEVLYNSIAAQFKHTKKRIDKQLRFFRLRI